MLDNIISLKSLILILIILVIAAIIIHFFFPLIVLLILAGIGYFIYKTYYKKSRW